MPITTFPTLLPENEDTERILLQKLLLLVAENAMTLDTVSALRSAAATDLARASTVNLLGYLSKGDGGGGLFWIDTNDTTTADDGGLCFVVGTVRIKRLIEGTYVSPLWFGAIPGDGIDDLPGFEAMIAAAGSTPMICPKGRFEFSDTIVLDANTAAGVGISGRTLRGVGFNGTSVPDGELSAEHTCFQANHTNAILKYCGVGGAVEDIQFVFNPYPTTSDTAAVCLLIGGNSDTVMCRFSRLRFMNGYRAIFAENGGYQLFSSIFQDIFILGFLSDGISLQAPGTQGLWKNIYITSSQTGATALNYGETTTSIVTVGAQSVFTITADFAASLKVGMLIQIAACDNAALIGLHSIVAVGATSITIDWASAPTAPTTATLKKLGGGSKVTGYAIESNQYREDEWENLNVEWLWFEDGKGILFGDRTTVTGLHLEGLGFYSASFSTGSLVRAIGSLVVVGWDLFNSWVEAGQTWFVFGPSGVNGRVTLLGGRMRDQYYGAGSTLAICGTFASLPEDSLYYDSVTTWNTTRFNRTGSFTGTNYAKKLVGADGNGLVSIGAATAGTVLALLGSASGVRALTIERSGVGKSGIGATTDGLNLYNETAGLGLGQWTANSSAVTLRLGTNYTSAAPSLTILGPDLTTVSNGAGGSLTIGPPNGTGNATGGGDINFSTPDAGASGATTQARTTKVKVKREGQLKFYPRSSAPTVNVEDGDAYYDTTLNKLRVRASGAWVDLH